MRLIDADELKIHVCDMCDDGQRECKGDESCAILCWINDMPTIKPEQRYGRWIFNEKLKCFQCSECGKYSLKGDVNYCRGCGARMDGGADNG